MIREGDLKSSVDYSEGQYLKIGRASCRERV